MFKVNFIKPATDRSQPGGDRSHTSTRARAFARTISSWTETNRSPRQRMARSLQRSRHRRRSALSQSPVRDESLRGSIRLPLPELPAGISAGASHSPRDCLSRVLPKTQRRRFRSAVSIEARDHQFLICHSDRSGGISYYFCRTQLVSTETSRDVSTSLDMTMNGSARELHRPLKVRSFSSSEKGSLIHRPARLMTTYLL